MDLFGKFLLAPRYQLGYDTAEDQQAGGAFDDRRQAKPTERHNIAVTDRQRGDEAKIYRRDKALAIGFDRFTPRLQSHSHADPGNPVDQTENDDHSEPKNDEALKRKSGDRLQPRQAMRSNWRHAVNVR